jgi:hypothetical protein
MQQERQQKVLAREWLLRMLYRPANRPDVVNPAGSRTTPANCASE